jgi:hypothetical protein
MAPHTFPKGKPFLRGSVWHRRTQPFSVLVAAGRGTRPSTSGFTTNPGPRPSLSIFVITVLLWTFWILDLHWRLVGGCWNFRLVIANTAPLICRGVNASLFRVSISRNVSSAARARRTSCACPMAYRT